MSQTKTQTQKILKLTGGRKSDVVVSWDPNIEDNEHMNKKKSKICCIYKKQRNWDESSSSSSEPETNAYERCKH